MARMKTRHIACAGVLAIVLIVASQVAWTQIADRYAAFREFERRVLAEPFKGVTSDGNVVPGLFRLAPTGVSTRPVRVAAEAFLDGLTPDQSRRTLFPVDDDEWRRWDNRHFPPRQGVSFKELTAKQRELAFGLMRASLSAKGLQQTSDIMKLNETLAELTQNWDEYGQWLYHLTVMGKPSDSEPWGWQLDGHHAIVNYFVLRDQVVMTPTFMGSEPVRAVSGKFKGAVVLQEEQNKGARLFAALDKAQQAKATLRSDKGPMESLAQAYQDNLVLAYAGIPASELNAAQKALLLELIAEYVGNMKEGHAKVKMDEVRAHLDSTWFAWIGGKDVSRTFYYRVQSPVILIEFDHQGRVAPVRSNVPTRDHIHTVVRTPNGNDYGKDLLRQHHQRRSHGPR